MIDKAELDSSAASLIVVYPKSAKFYLLPKIHKEGNPGRPVVSNIACPTYHISKFLSRYLKLLVVTCPTYIRDSVNMLDTTLSIQGDRMKATLYCRPTDTHSYLHYMLSHPTSCKNNIPYSQFLRIKRICTETTLILKITPMS